MTLQEIKDSDALFLTPGQVAKVLGVDPQIIRIQARNDASKLGFPVSVMKSRVKIPRRGFLKWMGEDGTYTV